MQPLSVATKTEFKFNVKKQVAEEIVVTGKKKGL